MVSVSGSRPALPRRPTPHHRGPAVDNLYAEQEFAGPPSGRPPTGQWFLPATPLHYPAHPEATPRPPDPGRTCAYSHRRCTERAPHPVMQHPTRSATDRNHPTPHTQSSPGGQRFPTIPADQHNYPTLPPHSQRTASATRHRRLTDLRER